MSIRAGGVVFTGSSLGSHSLGYDHRWDEEIGMRRKMAGDDDYHIDPRSWDGDRDKPL